MEKDSLSGSTKPETWWEKQRKEASDFKVEDCAECRYIATAGLYGAATYVAYVGVQRNKQRGSRTIWGAVPALITSAALLCLGTARFFHINPFSTSGDETGIDFVHKAFHKLSRPAVQETKESEDTSR